MENESGLEGELERNPDDNIDDKLDGNLDDKAGQIVRYATLSFLYLVQVKTFVSQIKIFQCEPVTGCPLWFPDHPHLCHLYARGRPAATMSSVSRRRPSSAW